MTHARESHPLVFYFSLVIFALVLAVNVSLSYSISVQKRHFAAQEAASQAEIHQILTAADEKRAQASRLRSAAEQLLDVRPDADSPPVEPIEKQPESPATSASTPTSP